MNQIVNFRNKNFPIRKMTPLIPGILSLPENFKENIITDICFIQNKYLILTDRSVNIK